MSLTEKELLLAINKRYRAGAELLYDNYAHTLYKVIYCTVKNKQLADEVLHNVINIIWNSIDTYTTQNNQLLLWMCGIAKQAALQKLNLITNQKALSQKLDDTGLVTPQLASA